jgi:hypothetical protein
VAATAIATIGIQAAPALAQEVEGGIVVARDVPERYAFLPGSGEALVVKTAPFLDVWAGISPGAPIPDSAADSVAAKTTSPGQDIHDMKFASADALRLEGNASALHQSSAQGSGIGALVGQSVDSGISSLHSGLGQLQTALGNR